MIGRPGRAHDDMRQIPSANQLAKARGSQEAGQCLSIMSGADNGVLCGEQDGLVTSVIAKTDVSIIIVSWNVSRLLADCLRSISTQNREISREVIVVDNHSTDDTLSVLKTEFGWVQLIANDRNLGFGPANNLALQAAAGRLIFMLNPDTVLKPGALEKLVRYLDSHPSVGIVGPKLLLPNESVQLSCARRLPSIRSLLVLRAFDVARIPVIGPWAAKKLVCPYDTEECQDVEAISGAAMLARKAILRSLGGFDPYFVHYGEDTDLCLRMRRAGYSVHYVAEAEVVHLSGRSERQAQTRVLVNSALSDYRYFEVHGGTMQRITAYFALRFIMPLNLSLRAFLLLLMKRIEWNAFRQRLNRSLALVRWEQIH
jgi:GT2 family glycosyltransferase